MKISPVCSIVAACSLLASVARGECVPASTAAASADCVIGVQWQGQRGEWLSLPKADEVSKQAAANAELARQVSTIRAAYNARTQQATLLTQALVEQKAATESVGKQTTAAQADTEVVRKERDEALTSKDSVWRSPWLWIGVGAALGGFVVYEVKK